MRALYQIRDVATDYASRLRWTFVGASERACSENAKRRGNDDVITVLAKEYGVREGYGCHGKNEVSKDASS